MQGLETNISAQRLPLLGLEQPGRGTGSTRNRSACPESLLTTGSSSCRTTPNANGSSSSEPLASSGVIRSCPAAARAARERSLAHAGGSLDKEQRPFSGARAIEPFTQRLKLAFALDQNSSHDERHKPDDTRRAGDKT